VVAIPTSIVCATIVTAISALRPPTEMGHWLFRCGMVGGFLGQVWLALGIYVNDRRTADELIGIIARGLLIAVPVGFIVGLALGAEMAVIDHLARKLQSRPYAKTVPLVTVIANAGLAVLLWVI
jgi:hypothetical protein